MRVPGVEHIPDIRSKIDAMIEKSRRETIDIEDVEFAEDDLEFDALLPDNPETDPDDGREERLL